MSRVWKSQTAGAVLILLLTVVAYMPAMRGGFLFDDRELITDNRLLKTGDGLYRCWFTTEAPDYYPVTSSLLWLEWQSWGKNVVGYHLVNLLLHVANAILIWLVLRRLKIPGAWLAGLVFALHPVNVATVAWVSEQKNTLSMLFYLTSIFLYLKFDEDRRWRWYSFSLAAFLLALLSKTAVVMLPVVLLGCVWWRRNKVCGKDLLRSAPFFVSSLVLGLVSVWFQYHHALRGHIVRTADFADRLAAAGYIPWFYLYKALLPVGLTVVYPQWEISTSNWTSYMPGLVLLGGFLVFWWKRETWGRPLLFGLGYFVVTLFPVLGFFDQAFYRFSLVADHWQYYSIAGLVALVIATGESLGRRFGGQRRYLGTTAGVVVVIFLGVSTWRRAGVYADSETLWRDNLAKNPSSWVAHYNLGLFLEQAGKPQEAIGHWEKALRIKPDFAEAHNNLGLALWRVGRTQEAIAHYEQALRLWPDFAEAHYNLGLAMWAAGNPQKAKWHWEQALRVKPDYANAHDKLGLALLQEGKAKEAVGHLQAALQVKPDDPEAHALMGLALWLTGEPQEAMEQWKEALRIKPDYPEAQNDLGNALRQTGKVQEAIKHFEEALRLAPEYAEAHRNLGVALLQVGKIHDAISQFQRALQIKPDYADAHYNLGVALRQEGKTKDAIWEYGQALKIKPNALDIQNNLAWLLATIEPSQGGDPVRALSLAQQVCQRTGNRVAACLDTLAAAYAAAGQFESAVTTAQSAIALARSAGQTQLVVEVESRLKLYQNGRPFRASLKTL